MVYILNPPASEASKGGANLKERKNLHTPIYGVKEYVCLSVCLSVVNFELSGLAEQNGLNKFS